MLMSTAHAGKQTLQRPKQRPTEAAILDFSQHTSQQLNPYQSFKQQVGTSALQHARCPAAFPVRLRPYLMYLTAPTPSTIIAPVMPGSQRG